MKREIKFRAWHQSLECMSEVLELDFQHDAIRCAPGHLPKNRISDCVLEQFTGLTDKNGTPIYEGDIVRCGANEFSQGKVLKVAYVLNAFVYVTDDEPESTSYYGQHITEVIGNIHQNPDLL